jgi:hypothetical protein
MRSGSGDSGVRQSGSGRSNSGGICRSRNKRRVISRNSIFVGKVEMMRMRCMWMSVMEMIDKLVQ